MAQSKISKYLGSPEFRAAATKAVQKAIGEQRAMGIEPVCDPTPHGPEIPGTITVHKDGTVTATTSEAMEYWNRTYPDNLAKLEKPIE